jgi:sugar-specific transcriptional regulator TrmB
MDALDESRNTFRQSLRRAQSALAELPREHEPEPEPELKSVELIDTWPTIDKRAIRGVIGDLVRAIEPRIAKPMWWRCSFKDSSRLATP